MNNSNQPNRRQNPQNPPPYSNPPRQNPYAGGQRPMSNGARPAPGGQRPMPNGQRPMQNGQRPMPNGQRPAPNGQRPAPNGQRPAPNGQRPAPNGTGMSRIGSQTPSNRRAAPQKIKLTAEQIEINRVNRQREKYHIKKRRGQAVKVFFSRLLLLLVIFAAMLGICAAGLFVSLNMQESTDSSGWSYVIDGKRSSLSYADAVKDGRVYVSFTDVAEMLDLAVTGSAEDMKYVIKGDEAETIRFRADTRVVYVNDVEARLAGDCYVLGDELYVPVEFVRSYFKGLIVEVDERANRVTIEREILNLDAKGNVPKGEEPEYAELAFLLRSMAPMDGIDEDEALEATMPDLGFATNLGIYEEYMNPGNTLDYLALINVDNPLASNYVPQDLMPVSSTRQDGRQEQMMRQNAGMALEAMFRELRAAGFEDVSVTSAYRSYSYQESLYNQRYQANLAQGMTSEQAHEATKEYTNPPGSSEHQSGLCADLHNLPSATDAFANEPAYKWLKENCWKFGFILRYPKDKESITGIGFEPWHYRYVGRYHALRMWEMNLCLEEYWEYLTEQ